MQALPANPQRIILINPTRYLGNLLIAGGLIQSFARHCHGSGIDFRLVVDAAYAELLRGAFKPDVLLPYPRARIAAAGTLAKAGLYLETLGRIRALCADIAFNLEEDSVSHRLTQLSGASYKLGCSTQRHGLGYSQVLPISFASRPAERQHRWFSFQEVFTALGLHETQPAYIALNPEPLSGELKKSLTAAGVDFSKQIAVLHAGATKAYKLWPPEHFAELAHSLQQQGMQVVLIGSGKDAGDIDSTLQKMAPTVRAQCINLCNRMSLAQLAAFFRHVAIMVGNDSGPFHLAAAMGVTGVVIFGPTRVDLWRPMSDRIAVLKDGSMCHPDCTRKHCLYEHRCLKAITPQMVTSALASLQAP